MIRSDSMRSGITTDYAKQVKKRLVDLDMTQAELAKEIGTSQQYLTSILSGKRSGKTFLNKINAILQIDKEIA